jgi:hypothetical protein
MPHVKEMIELVCSGCGDKFMRSMRSHKQRLKRGRTRPFCKSECRKPKPPHSCIKCGLPTTNPKFCSRSCAASITGSTHPKRVHHRTPQTCADCGEIYYRSKSHAATRICQTCLAFQRNNRAHRGLKLGALMKTPSLKGKHPSWRSAHIRILNRLWNASMLKLSCTKCEYSIHVELAHIRDITSFPDSATLGEINEPSNVVQLCRNCHWEFDHGLCSIEQILEIIYSHREVEQPARFELASFQLR